MRETITFFIPCVPPKSTSQQKGIVIIGGKPRHFKKKAIRDAEDTLLALFSQHAPETPLQGPLRLELIWRYPWRKSEPQKNKVLTWKWCPTRPDCSNLVKLAEDCLTRLRFWEDDSQVASLEFRKFWSNNPGILVYIEELEERK